MFPRHDVLAFPVRYTPHAEHTHLKEHPELAAVIGRVHEDGTADLMVFVPNKEPHWQDKVPQGFGPHTWHHVHDEAAPAEAEEETGDAAGGATPVSEPAPAADPATQNAPPPAPPAV